MKPHSHNVDVKALLRISVIYVIPTARNRATADFIVSSKSFNKENEPIIKDFIKYIKLNINLYQ